MQSSKTLRRPANWQDFESLCKKLWGEIWKCPEIQKNGRLGQDQYGVDIFGVPAGENGYYGIQCKGKSEYFGNQFSEAEIKAEVEKAKTFPPALKKYYLATTASNDAKIQAFVRKLNLEQIGNGLFEVHLFCWETIVDLIDENRETYDWYVNSQNFKTDRSVTLTFDNNSNEIAVHPVFNKNTLDLSDTGSEYLDNAAHKILKMQNLFASLHPTATKANLSYSSFQILLHNTGINQLENYKIIVEFDGRFQDIAKSNESGGHSFAKNFHSSIVISSKAPFTCELLPENKVLVSDDKYTSHKIFIKPEPIESRISLRWKMISKDFKADGELFLNVLPKIIPTPFFPYVNGIRDSQQCEGTILDHLETIQD